MSLIFSAGNFSLSFSSKVGDGKKVYELNDSQKSDYKYFENIIDLNYYYNQNFHFYSQFEYTSPPLIGKYNNDINKAYFEYNNEKYDIKFGDINFLSGYGLSVNSYQDHSLDYDNLLKGIEINYNINDVFSIRAIKGWDEFNFYSSQAQDSSDLFYDLSSNFYDIQYNGDLNFFNLNIYTVFYSFQKSKNKYDNSLLDDFALGYPNKIIAYQIEYQGNSDNIFLNLNQDNDVEFFTNDYTHTLGFQSSILSSDLYIEKSFVNYQKLFTDEYVDGSRLYFSIYKNLLNFDISYDHINYDSKYQINNLLSPPTCMLEVNSVLSSRNDISIDFNNSLGNQIEIRRDLFGFDWLFNTSIYYKKYAHTESGEITSKNLPSFFNMLKFDIDDYKSYNDKKEFYPKRIVYSELSKWFNDDKFFLKGGFFSYRSLTSVYEVENSLTYPFQYSYNFSGGKSINGYIEYQDRTKIKNIHENLNKHYHYNTIYNSFSYTFNYDYVFSIFSEIEKDQDQLEKKWSGFELAMRFLGNNNISVFYGSQRGGLICSNGTCAYYPGFEEGFKATLRINYDI